MKRIFLLLLVIVTGLVVGKMALSFAFPAQFPMTGVNQFEVKQLPASVSLEVAADGDYFAHNNNLFRQLFQHISSHKIGMTVPVEAELSPAAMRFYVTAKDQEKIDSELIAIRREHPARTVASLGKRGGYSEKNVQEAIDELAQWLSTQPSWSAEGEPYAVFWHGPFLPNFLKRFEVHQPVKPQTKLTTKPKPSP